MQSAKPRWIACSVLAILPHLQKLTLEAARGVKALLDAGKGLEVVREILTVSTEGRAPKQGPGVFALALCCR